jgi:hypothetical protein
MEKFSLYALPLAEGMIGDVAQDGATQRALQRGGGPKPGNRRGVSQRTLANLVKGARAGGFEPYEIVLETTGEVRLRADFGQGPLTDRPNDFDQEFG